VKRGKGKKWTNHLLVRYSSLFMKSLKMSDLATWIDLHRIEQVDRRYQLLFVLRLAALEEIIRID